ncbi:MAG: 3-dehydroquinate synthase [Prevotellaceae bacterium]|jgi:3-dehydroquinate synthase|nr:3-dehydroquinate synthase [Prevotellaceae bacterium]
MKTTKFCKIDIELEKWLADYEPSQIFILTDENTKKHCLPRIISLEKIKNAKVIEIPAGDENKNLDSLTKIWTFLSRNGATRKSLLINLGGGMVTDIGGFAASTFKRGMTYINVPTSLLGTIDAAVGGKTGINFGGLKNEIGVINPAKIVLIDTAFFKTLDYANNVSGYAELVKHALIDSPDELRKLLAFDLENLDVEKLRPLLETSVEIKEKIVAKDPYEKNIRKALNFGHTIGHAFESLSYERNAPILHGFAVAYGMVCELYLSYVRLGFPKEILSRILHWTKEVYGKFPLSCKQYERLYELMTHDKKNEDSSVNFTLLGDVGDIRINQVIEKEDIFDALDFYQEN